MPTIVLIQAHPHPRRSVAGSVLLDAVRDLPGIEVRALYDLYPDYAIDVRAERTALAAARLVIWQNPLYWYGVPSLLQRWFEVVLERGWAFGDGGTALAGKDCLWVTTTGASVDDFSADGRHGAPFESFVPPVRQTARFCGMRWMEPIVVHAAHRCSADVLRAAAADYRARLEAALGAYRAAADVAAG